MKSSQIKSISMKNLRNPAATIATLDFESYGSRSRPHNKMNDGIKVKTARHSLHRYIFVICHTTQHFGHHLAANELKLVQNACKETLQWMWCSEMRSLEDYRLKIAQLLQICTPLMQRLFHAEKNIIEKHF